MSAGARFKEACVRFRKRGVNFTNARVRRHEGVHFTAWRRSSRKKRRYVYDKTRLFYQGFVFSQKTAFATKKKASVFHKEAFATNGGLSFTRGGVRFAKRGVRNGIIRRGEGTTTRDHEEKKHKAKKERRKNGKHKEKKYRPYVQQERTRRKHRTKKKKKGARRKGKIGVRPVKIYTKYEYDE